MSAFVAMINRIARTVNMEIRRFPNANDRRVIAFLKANNIKNCVDVGANDGQFALRLKEIGFKGNIFSFEPQTEAFRKLENNASKHANWKVYNYALGDFDGQSTINLSSNSVSSSLLGMMPQHSNAAPESAYIGTQTIEVKKLDSIYQPLVGSEKIFLKIDTQGFESKVLKGAEQALANVQMLELEMSCVELYNGEMLFDDMKRHIESMGFQLCTIEGGFADERSGKLLQVEAVFIRTK